MFRETVKIVLAAGALGAGAFLAWKVYEEFWGDGRPKDSGEPYVTPGWGDGPDVPGTDVPDPREELDRETGRARVLIEAAGLVEDLHERLKRLADLVNSGFHLSGEPARGEQ